LKPTIQEIQEILKIFLDSGLQDLRLEIGDVRLAVSKTGALSTGGAAQPLTRSPSRGSQSETVPAAAPASVVGAPADDRATGAAPQKPGLAAARNGWVAVSAPSLGVFYRRPAPDQPPFVEVGDRVDKDAPLCLLEVMKMYSRVTAPCEGRIAEIMLEDGHMAEYGQTLMFIDPA